MHRPARVVTCATPAARDECSRFPSLTARRAWDFFAVVCPSRGQETGENRARRWLRTADVGPRTPLRVDRLTDEARQDLDVSASSRVLEQLVPSARVSTPVAPYIVATTSPLHNVPFRLVP